MTLPIVERLRLTPDCDVRQISDNCVEAADAIEALVEALELIERTPAWGAPERWEATPAEVRMLARTALAKARGETP